MVRINIDEDGLALARTGYFPPFSLIDEDGPSAAAVREINEACEHISKACSLFREENDEVLIFVPRINNFNDEMKPRSLIALLVAMVLPYYAKLPYDRAEHVRICIGTTVDAELRILGWFLERVAAAITPSFEPDYGESVIRRIIGDMNARQKLTAALMSAFTGEKVSA